MTQQDELNYICQVLRQDKVIICPTDTIWGLSCSVTSESATKRIYNIKNREIGKPFILLVADLQMLKRYVTSIHPRIETLLAYHRKPLTIIYPNPRFIPAYALASDGSIGIRIVQDESCADIIRGLNAPLVSTSANYSNDPSPLCYADINKKLLTEVDYVAQYGQEQEELHQPSVIIRFDEEGQIEILRP